MFVVGRKNHPCGWELLLEAEVPDVVIEFFAECVNTLCKPEDLFLGIIEDSGVEDSGIGYYNEFLPVFNREGYEVGAYSLRPGVQNVGITPDQNEFQVGHYLIDYCQECGGVPIEWNGTCSCSCRF